ncbi:MAG: hypothetical protein L0Y39_11705 [Methylococcaceae bacterium]|nr:hypothetical protein [Methylococcaceae bacterium]
MKGKIVFPSTALAGMLAAASVVHAAADIKVFAGHACHAFIGGEAADLQHFANFTVNIGAADRFVICPIVRDNHKNLDGVKSVSVRVRSPNATTLTCTLGSDTSLGVLVETDTNSTTSNVVTNLPLDINSSTKNGIYYLFCDLPPGGEVYGYRVVEFEI